MLTEKTIRERVAAAAIFRGTRIPTKRQERLVQMIVDLSLDRPLVAERQGLALWHWIGCGPAAPHTHDGGGPPFRTADAAGASCIRSDRCALALFSGCHPTSLQEPQHRLAVAEYGLTYPMRFPLPQVSQLEPEPLAKWMGGEYAGSTRGG